MRNQEFEKLLTDLLDPKPEVRLPAEEMWENAKKDPNTVVPLLIDALTLSTYPAVKLMATTQLIQFISIKEGSMWPHISEAVRGQLRTRLTDHVKAEQWPAVRPRMGDLIGDLFIALQSSWPEFLPWLLGCTTAEDPTVRETAYYIFSRLAFKTAATFRPYLDQLHGTLTSGLQDSNVQVRVAALSSVANFLCTLNEGNERQVFQSLTHEMVLVIHECLNQGKEDNARDAIQLLCEVGDLLPSFFRPHLPEFVDSMCEIASSVELEDSTRQVAAEMIVTLVEGNPAMMRKLPNFLDRYLPAIFELLFDLEDDPAWYTASDNADDDDFDNSDVAEEILDRMALNLGGAYLVPSIFGMLPNLLNDEDWKKRYGALMAISVIGEGCKDTLEPHLAEIVHSLVPRFTDPHPRVRWAACHTIGQMCVDYGPHIQISCHADIVPNLILDMGDVDNPRVQAHAASSVISFCEHGGPPQLDPYMEDLLNVLGALLTNTTVPAIHEQAVTAIGAVADRSPAEFIKYYDSFMPLLHSILVGATSVQQQRLQGKAVECITLIGAAVGKKRFKPEADQIIPIMIALQQEEMKPEDPRFSYLIAGWARIMRVLKEEFVPFLEFVIPPLLGRIQHHEENITLVQHDAPHQDGWDYYDLGDSTLGVNTAGLEEKAAACNMIFCYAVEMKSGFYPWVRPVFDLLAPLCKFQYTETVRTSSVCTMPYLVRSAVLHVQGLANKTPEDEEMVAGLLRNVLEVLMEATRVETSTEALLNELEAFHQTLDYAPPILPDEWLQNITDFVLHHINASNERMANRENNRGEDWDEESERKLARTNKKEIVCQNQAAEAVGRMLKTYGARYLPLFESVWVPRLQEMLRPQQSALTRQIALCIIDDCIEFLPGTAVQYGEDFIPPLLVYLADPDTHVRQAAVYGCGALAQYGGESVNQLMPQMVQALQAVIDAPESRKKPYLIPGENAISSLGKIAQYQGGPAINPAEVMTLYLNYLPLKEDKLEGKDLFERFATMLREQHPVFLGENFSNLPRIITILAEVLSTDFLEPAQHNQILGLLKQVQGSLPAELQNTVWGQLEAKTRNRLQNLKEQVEVC